MRTHDTLPEVRAHTDEIPAALVSGGRTVEVPASLDSGGRTVEVPASLVSGDPTIEIPASLVPGGRTVEIPAMSFDHDEGIAELPAASDAIRSTDELPATFDFDRRTDELPAVVSRGQPTDEIAAAHAFGQLVVVAGAEQVAWTLGPGRSTIGAAASCSHTLAVDGVADVHLEIRAGVDGVVAHALGPLRHNGKRVSEARLASGDELRLGSVRLLYVAAGGAFVRRQTRRHLLLWAAGGFAAGYLAILLLSAFAWSAEAGQGLPSPAVPPRPLDAEPHHLGAGAQGEIATGGQVIAGAAEPSTEDPWGEQDRSHEADDIREPLPYLPLVEVPFDSPAPGAAALDSHQVPVPLARPTDVPATDDATEERSARLRAAAGAALEEGGTGRPAPKGAQANPRTRSTEQRRAVRERQWGAGAPTEMPSPAEKSINEAPPPAGTDPTGPVANLEQVQLAWQAGALDEMVALARASGDPAALRLADLARRFARAVVRARHAPGLAAVPALEEALGLAAEIGREAPAVQEVRQRLSQLHLAAAGRALRSGDRRGALHHVEEALAILPRDAEARRLREAIGAEAAAVYREAYALQHLERKRAASLAEEAALLAMPGDPVAERARKLAARLAEADGTGGEW